MGEKRANRGKHRTEVTEVTEGETACVRGFRWTWVMGEKHANPGKHRTEVTEATEGETALCVRGFRWTTWLMGEKHANPGKHRTEVTEVTEATEGERDVVDERVWWTSVADGREKSEKENTGNQRPIAIEELSKSKAVRIKRLAGV
jgi:hypothetical protein